VWSYNVVYVIRQLPIFLWEFQLSDTKRDYRYNSPGQKTWKDLVSSCKILKDLVSGNFLQDLCNNLLRSYTILRKKDLVKPYMGSCKFLVSSYHHFQSN